VFFIITERNMPENHDLFLKIKQDQTRKKYRKPELVELGDLRTVTLGPSVGPDGGIILPDGSALMPDGRIIPPWAVGKR
jgi:hypothetical protein